MNETIDNSLQKEISVVTSELSSGVAEIFKDSLIGVYLFGSLTYGDFNDASSDIDLVTILEKPADSDQIDSLKKLHNEIEAKYPRWSKRIESSYTPRFMLGSILPPGSRPYYGEGIFYLEADYGNEWIINLYLLYNYGRVLIGPSFSTLIESVDIKEVHAACIRDLHQEWEPKLREPEWLDNPHYQSYLILNLCRIFNTVRNASTLSKKKSAAWVKSTFPQWSGLITEAENWKYDLEMNRKDETLRFLQFVLDEIGDSEE